MERALSPLWVAGRRSPRHLSNERLRGRLVTTRLSEPRYLSEPTPIAQGSLHETRNLSTVVLRVTETRLEETTRILGAVRSGLFPEPLEKPSADPVALRFAGMVQHR